MLLVSFQLYKAGSTAILSERNALKFNDCKKV